MCLCPHSSPLLPVVTRLHTPGPCSPVPGASSMVTCVPGWVTVGPPRAGGTGCTECSCGRGMRATGSVPRGSLGTTSPWGGQRGLLLSGTVVTPQRRKLLGCYFRQKV